MRPPQSGESLQLLLHLETGLALRLDQFMAVIGVFALGFVAGWLVLIELASLLYVSDEYCYAISLLSTRQFFPPDLDDIYSTRI